MSNSTGVLIGLVSTAVFAGVLAPLLLVLGIAAGSVLLGSASLRLAAGLWRSLEHEPAAARLERTAAGA